MATPITSSRKAHDCLKWAWVDSSFPPSVRCVYEFSPSLYQSFERLVCVIGVLCELCEHPPEIFPQSRLLVDLGTSFWHILHLEDISDLIIAVCRIHTQCVNQRLLELSSMKFVINQTVVSVFVSFRINGARPLLVMKSWYVVSSMTNFFIETKK